MSWAQGRTLHTTRTGRAKPNGRTTRKSHSVKLPKYPKGKGQDRPLPFSHACHPQALTRTPIHPGCLTDNSSYNVSQWDDLTVIDFVEGVGLCHIPYPGLWEVRWPSGDHLGWAYTPADAMSYKHAALRVGVRLNVYQPEA